MIIEFIMDILKAVILFIISLFPKLPDFTFIASWLAPIGDITNTINYFISIPAVILCLSAIMLCYNARFLWSLVIWVLKKIPGVD